MNSSPKNHFPKISLSKNCSKKFAALEKQLQWEKLRAETLDTMINIAEKDLNILIRKKPGAQQ